MRRTKTGGTHSSHILVHILTEILHLHIHHADTQARHGETLGRIEAKLTEKPKEKRAAKIFSTATTILGHWGTISAMAVAAYKFIIPHIRAWLGL